MYIFVRIRDLIQSLATYDFHIKIKIEPPKQIRAVNKYGSFPIFFHLNSKIHKVVEIRSPLSLSLSLRLLTQIFDHPIACLYKLPTSPLRLPKPKEQHAPLALYLHPHDPLLALASASLRRHVDHIAHSDGGRGLLLPRGRVRLLHFVDVFLLPRLRLGRLR